MASTIIRILRDIVANNLMDPTKQEPPILVMPSDAGAYKAYEIEIHGPSRVIMLPPGSPEQAAGRILIETEADVTAVTTLPEWQAARPEGTDIAYPLGAQPKGRFVCNGCGGITRPVWVDGIGQCHLCGLNLRICSSRYIPDSTPLSS